MNRELLDKPFEQRQIKQRDGNCGKKLDYIEGHCVIARLNAAFESEWSFSILEHRILEQTDEVLVVGQLRAGNVVKTQFGSSRITRARESGEPIGLSDDYKAAATDAIKKCASLLGVGLHLYTDNIHSRSETPENGRSGSGNGNGRISARQHKFCLDLATSKGITKNELNQKCLNAFGSVLDYISRSDASSLISELQSN